jgi:excisionase family DNA binding protein
LSHSDHDPYLSLREIAAELNVSTYAVRKWILDGKLEGIKVGKMYRVRRSDLDRMLVAGRVQGAAAASREPGSDYGPLARNIRDD